jgi:hypothetical protein
MEAAAATAVTATTAATEVVVAKAKPRFFARLPWTEIAILGLIIALTILVARVTLLHNKVREIEQRPAFDPALVRSTIRTELRDITAELSRRKHLESEKTAALRALPLPPAVEAVLSAAVVQADVAQAQAEPVPVVPVVVQPEPTVESQPVPVPVTETPPEPAVEVQPVLVEVAEVKAPECEEEQVCAPPKPKAKGGAKRDKKKAVSQPRPAVAAISAIQVDQVDQVDGTEHAAEPQAEAIPSASA